MPLYLFVCVCNIVARSLLEHSDGDEKDKPVDLYIREKLKERGG